MRTDRGELLLAEEDLRPREFAEFYDLPTPASVRARHLAEVLLERGETDEAQAMLASVEPERLDYARRTLFLFTTGRVELEAGRFEQAVTHLRTAGSQLAVIGIENPAWAPWRSQAALALRHLERDDEARKLAREELALSRRWGAPRTVGVSLRALGLVEQGEAREQLLQEAVTLFAKSGARLEHARALVDLGAALRRGNSRTEARRFLRDGIDLAHHCGASALVERANEELAATGAHRRTILLRGVDELTASERRVAQMAAEELSNKEIAQALFVTVKTVEQHLGRVYRKLEISSRRQLGGALAGPAAGIPE
jgi:DNA-binding CsgD family transcriptional regulator